MKQLKNWNCQIDIDQNILKDEIIRLTSDKGKKNGYFGT